MDSFFYRFLGNELAHKLAVQRARTEHPMAGVSRRKPPSLGPLNSVQTKPPSEQVMTVRLQSVQMHLKHVCRNRYKQCAVISLFLGWEEQLVKHILQKCKTIQPCEKISMALDTSFQQKLDKEGGFSDRLHNLTLQTNFVAIEQRSIARTSLFPIKNLTNRKYGNMCQPLYLCRVTNWSKFVYVL